MGKHLDALFDGVVKTSHQQTFSKVTIFVNHGQFITFLDRKEKTAIELGIKQLLVFLSDWSWEVVRPVGFNHFSRSIADVLITIS